MKKHLTLLCALALIGVVSAQDDYTLVWNQDFTGTSLNTEAWNIEVNGDGDEGKQVQDIAADGDCRHSRAADILTDDDHIHDIIDRLQGVGDKEGEGELEQQAGDAALGQVADHGAVHGMDLLYGGI